MEYCVFCIGTPRQTLSMGTYKICGYCYGGARMIRTLGEQYDKEYKSSTNSPPSPYLGKGLAREVGWLKEMMETEKLLKKKIEEQNEVINYLGEFGVVLRDGVPSDIEIKPGNNGPSITAHKPVLAAKSIVLRNILDLDGCKAPPGETITMSELNHEELQSLLEFIYSGNLPKEKLEKHLYSLTLAADKYDISLLQKVCENHLLATMCKSNVLDVLEISDMCSNRNLKDTALNFIVTNIEEIVLSERFEAFGLENPHLAVEITREACNAKRNKRIRL